MRASSSPLMVVLSVAVVGGVAYGGYRLYSGNKAAQAARDNSSRLEAAAKEVAARESLARAQNQTSGGAGGDEISQFAMKIASGGAALSGILSNSQVQGAISGLAATGGSAFGSFLSGLA